MTDRGRDPLASWPAFAEAVRARLEADGDRSFALPPTVLVGELEAEAFDLAGWGFVLWCRLRALHEAAKRLERHGEGGR